MARTTQSVTERRKKDLVKSKEGENAKLLLDILAELEADTKTQVLKAMEKSPASDLLEIQTQYKAVLKVKNWLTSRVNSGKLAEANLNK